MEKLENKYQYLLGKDKKEVIKEFNDEFNFFPSNLWVYTLKTKWFIVNTFLLISFDDDKVVKICVKNSIGKKNYW